METVNCIEEIQHPSVKETLMHLKINEGLEIHHDGDIPARSGMGSSSAFTVGLLKTLYALNGRVISKEDLYKEAIHIEQNLIKENVGSQDQVWAACGGLNTIEFLQNGEIIVEPIIMKEDHLRNFESRFMLFFTGLSRFASIIAREQIQNTRKNRDELLLMHGLVDSAREILTSGRNDFIEFGRFLNETWKLKKKLSSKITNTDIDAIYETAMKNGAAGGKLCGAGGGGFVLFYVEPENQERVRKALGNFLHVPFRFDFSGSEIIVYQPSYQRQKRRQ